MENLTLFAEHYQKNNWTINYFLFDIDDTLTTEGQLRANAYEALWLLHNHGLKLIPITGRPAGWCEMIARFWPVDGIIGENGGVCFYYDNKHMHRIFSEAPDVIKQNQQKLSQLQDKILSAVSSVAVASDQFSRLTDLAIDFCEDVPHAPTEDIYRVKKIFENEGAIAKISSIHVNGWFGSHNKLSTTLKFVQQKYGLSKDNFLNQAVYIGDSPNDEPMFEAFPISFGVANIKNFEKDLKHLPKYVSRFQSGDGFTEVAKVLLQTIIKPI